MAGGSLFQVGEAVEFWRVLVHLSILALCLLIFEGALHHIEHKLSRYDKYQHMLRKAYRELMVLGLLSLGLKLLKEVPGIHADSKTMLAFQVADLSIFILALALILQSICVFMQLRKHNNLADRTELVTAQDIVDALSVSPANEEVSTIRFSWFCSSSKGAYKPFEKEIIERRLLRHLFLRRFGLPQLFPFSKYLRRGQANQISHMIEVEPSMWLLLLAVAWAICGLVALLGDLDVDMPAGHELVEVLVVFAWILVGLHIVVLLYFRSCMKQLLNVAGYSGNKVVLVANLIAIAEEERVAWLNEAADNALDTMNRVQEEQEEIEEQTNVTKDRTDRVMSFIQSRSPEIHIRFFSRKAWHVAVMFLLILNGFFIALFVQCAVYDLDDIYGEFGLLPAVMVPLPLAVNTLFLQQSIFRHFVMICSILRIDSTTLGEVVNHFSEIVELRSEFASSLAQCLREGEYTATDLRTELRGHDLRETGFIDLDNLRIVLAAFGFRLTRFRFNSVAKLLFELEGTKVEYGQLLRLIMLAQQDSCGESGVGNQRRQHPLLQRSGTSLNESGRNNFRTNFASARQVPLLAQPSLGSEPSPSDFVHVGTGTPVLLPMRHAASSIASESHGKNGKGGKPMLERSYTSQFAGSSSRALHDMFNIRRRVGSRAEAEVPNSAYTML
ncbi:hypothetical protein BBJ29_006206 [Phytophthora kernoviae]|uniref:EF-hand domain-containing protein n=1 Tax=Phytophthora kernoviae TaxID=325452 RepID=A0A3F2RGZ6_9STRA|nr:hypothetical protein BBJ29_006206 [Phytophthora kernoviae]RLN56729.1 hypothetical protein BBP00_00007848 [Phytophthora kernoviae]